MDKSVVIFRTTFVLTSLIAFCSCIEYNRNPDFVFLARIDSASVAKEVVIPLPTGQRFTRQRVVIKENTLNDTCKIGIQKIPPGRTGMFYDTKFPESLDTLRYPYIPYKASSGKLVYEHIFAPF